MTELKVDTGASRIRQELGSLPLQTLALQDVEHSVGFFLVVLVREVDFDNEPGDFPGIEG